MEKPFPRQIKQTDKETSQSMQTLNHSREPVCQVVQSRIVQMPLFGNRHSKLDGFEIEIVEQPNQVTDGIEQLAVLPQVSRCRHSLNAFL
jgi:hypothetical protein